MARTTIWKFTVRGKSQFPFDMLRYDQAWPTDRGVLPLSAVTRGENRYDCKACDGKGKIDDAKCEACNGFGLGRLEPVEIDLATHTQSGPTADRWASFGWYVTKSEKSYW